MSQDYATTLSKLMELGIALTGEADLNSLLTKVLEAAVDLTDSQGGTIYTVSEEDDHLLFFVALNRVLNIRVGGSYEKDGASSSMTALPLYTKATGQPNHSNIACHAWHKREVVNVEDVYGGSHGFDVAGVKGFDASMNYRTEAIMSVPVINRDGRVICVLQMINRMGADGNVIPFDSSIGKHTSVEYLLKAIASQAGVAIENQDLIHGERELWGSLLKMMASLIDKKSPYTGGHCLRVPILTNMIAQAANDSEEGVFSNFHMSDKDFYELNVAAWLHDIGKVTTPEYVVDKSVKLETIYNRIHEVRMRFEVLARDSEIAYWKAVASGEDKDVARKKMDEVLAELQEEFAFVGLCNMGSEFMDQEKLDRLQQISGRKWRRNFDRSIGVTTEERERLFSHQAHKIGGYEHLLEDAPEDKIVLKLDGGDRIEHYNQGDIYNLGISKGTLTEEERLKIQEHVAVTIDVLKNLPLPRHLRNVVEYAGGHHERVDGKGYPNGLTRDELSLPARMMAVADVFEALTAADRPYRPGKTLSQSLGILSHMSKDGHIDSDIYSLFVKSGKWFSYAQENLLPEQIDIPDVEAYIQKALSA